MLQSERIIRMFSVDPYNAFYTKTHLCWDVPLLALQKAYLNAEWCNRAILIRLFKEIDQRAVQIMLEFEYSEVWYFGVALPMGVMLFPWVEVTRLNSNFKLGRPIFVSGEVDRRVIYEVTQKILTITAGLGE